MLRYKKLINWQEYLNFIKYNFKTKEKINTFRYSFKKIKELLESWNNFIFVSGTPDFIFDIYLDWLKDYVAKNLWKAFANNIFWFWSHVSMNNPEKKVLDNFDNFKKEGINYHLIFERKDLVFEMNKEDIKYI